jgi:hypothetical protein
MSLICSVSTRRPIALLISVGFALLSQHPANAAGPSLGRFDFGRRPASCSFVCDDLLEALDSIRGEGRHTIFADTVNPEAAVFGFHIDLKVPEPFFGLAELFGDILEREDV